MPRLCNASKALLFLWLHNAYPSQGISSQFFANANDSKLCRRSSVRSFAFPWLIVSPPMLSTLSRAIAMSRCVLLLFAVAWRLNAVPLPSYAKPLPSRLCFSLASPSVAVSTQRFASPKHPVAMQLISTATLSFAFSVTPHCFAVLGRCASWRINAARFFSSPRLFASMLCHFTSAHAVSLPQLFPSSQSKPLLSPLILAVPLHSHSPAAQVRAVPKRRLAVP